jgi:hypothetical protein
MSALSSQRVSWPAVDAAAATPVTRRRASRVIVLLGGIVALSAADLVATISHLEIGMIESNPLARLIIESTNSMGALAAFKVATVAVCVAVIYRLRASAQGEAAAWMATLILCALTVWWGVASSELTHPDAISSQMDQVGAAGSRASVLAAPSP